MFPKQTLPSDSMKLLGLLKTKNEGSWLKRGEAQALSLFHNMAARVPAYADFLKKNTIDHRKIKTITDFHKVPLTSKENYLLVYPLHDLCWDGKFTGQRWTIASTSGSTGKPYYFPRTQLQDEQFKLTAEAVFVDFFRINKKTTLFVDCFALGVWIGGMFMYQAVKYIMDSGLYPLSVITPGADKTEAIKAIKNLAPKFDQIVIGGYAPLVKDLIDLGAHQGVAWKKMNAKYFFAAEGFTEGYRDYIVKYGGAKNIYTDTINHYGTADLGTMANETPLTVLLRRTAGKNTQLAQTLFGQPFRQPTLTQYVPELYYFEKVNGRVVCSAAGGMPLVRYDLKDRGGVFTLEQATKMFKSHGLDLKKEIKRTGISKYTWQLPFVYLFERDDLTASIYSVNIYPQSIQKALQGSGIQHYTTGKFTMLVDYDKKHNQFLQINIEMKEGKKSAKGFEKKVMDAIVKSLLRENSEWRDFYNDQTIRHKVLPKLIFWKNQDPLHFKSGAKQKWVKKKT